MFDSIGNDVDIISRFGERRLGLENGFSEIHFSICIEKFSIQIVSDFSSILNFTNHVTDDRERKREIFISRSDS
jgi:hypothetical protein